MSGASQMPAIKRVLLTRAQIQARAAELACEIVNELKGGQEPPIFVCIMGGAVHFFSDLLLAIGSRLSLIEDSMIVKSYEGKQSSGNVKVITDLKNDIAGRDVVVVEDIIDTGLTIHRLKHFLGSREPRSLRFCVMLDKVDIPKVPGVSQPDWVGFDIPNHFVIGYGLDLVDGLFRHLPYVAICQD